MLHYHRRDLLSYMPRVRSYDESISNLNSQWENIKLLCEINCPQESENILPQMSRIQNRFTNLKSELIDTLTDENLKKTTRKMISKAQVTVDILIRNLYERTADVGFLATDHEICSFLQEPVSSYEQIMIIRQRLQEYVAKYSVYEEIIIIDCAGVVRANLDQENDILGKVIEDEIFTRTLESDRDFEESFQPSRLLERREKAHVFSRNIYRQNTNEVLGTIFLCFYFEDEMRLIFNKMTHDYDGSVISIVDADNVVIASSDENYVPIGITTELIAPSSQSLVYYRGQACLSYTVETQGYESYYGLGWKGHVIVPLQLAFAEKKRLDGVEEQTVSGLLEMADSFSIELKTIIRNTGKINNLLNRIVYNGQVMAGSGQDEISRLRPILNAIGQIGSKTSRLFQSSVSNLFATVVSRTLEDADYLASLCVDIMDRNLYERANDCRWWALHSQFRSLLAGERITQSGKHKMGLILRYIHSLYTVYSKLFIFDRNGEILAASTIGEIVSANGQDLIVSVSNTDDRFDDSNKEQEDKTDMFLGNMVKQILSNTSPDRYFVSSFEPTSLYNGAPTYIYGSSITDPQKPDRTVGGIGIVFDSSDQFRSMLTDALKGSENSFAIYTDRAGTILSTSELKNADLEIGHKLDIQSDFFNLAKGDSRADIIVYRGCYYALGSACSSGYREFKSSDGYDNDILAFVFEKLTECTGSETDQLESIEEVTQSDINLRNESPRLKIATFSINAQLFAIEESAVLEVIDTNTVISIPDMSGQLAGAVSYRGQYIAVVNTRHMLGHELSDTESLNLLVISSGNEQAETIAMIVDGLHRVLEINEEMLQAVPITSSIQGIVNISGKTNKTIIVLNQEALFARLDKGDFHQEWQKLLASQ